MCAHIRAAGPMLRTLEGKGRSLVGRGYDRSIHARTVAVRPIYHGMSKTDVQFRRHCLSAAGEHAVCHRTVRKRRDYATMQCVRVQTCRKLAWHRQ